MAEYDCQRVGNRPLIVDDIDTFRRSSRQSFGPELFKIKHCGRAVCLAPYKSRCNFSAAYKLSWPARNGVSRRTHFALSATRHRSSRKKGGMMKPYIFIRIFAPPLKVGSFGRPDAVLRQRSSDEPACYAVQESCLGLPAKS